MAQSGCGTSPGRGTRQVTVLVRRRPQTLTAASGCHGSALTTRTDQRLCAAPSGQRPSKPNRAARNGRSPTRSPDLGRQGEPARHPRAGAVLPGSGRRGRGGRSWGGLTRRGLRGSWNHREESLDQGVPATEGKRPGLRATYVRVIQAADGSRRHGPVLADPGGNVSTACGTWHPGFFARSLRVWRTARTLRAPGGHRRPPGRSTPSASHRPWPCRRRLSSADTSAARTGTCPARCTSFSADQR